MKDVRHWVSILFFAVVFLILAAEQLFAQCAMCRASINGSGNAALVKSLNIGIVVLLVPPVAIFCSVFIVAVRRRGEAKDSSENRE